MKNIYAIREYDKRFNSSNPYNPIICLYIEMNLGNVVFLLSLQVDVEN